MKMKNAQGVFANNLDKRGLQKLKYKAISIK